ncbi:MAG: hypothetical protein FJW37_10540 [Acidobacteria bacterium]|nr:hypothetical protein [Acidobacteriota bacterium]
MGLAFWLASHTPAQVIEFESNGLKYQTLTKNGVTVMFAPLPAHLRDFAIFQVSVSNGSRAPCSIRPEDFQFARQDGTVLRAMPARSVVQVLLEKGGRNDVVKLVSAYEAALYGLSRTRSTNGYEQRRQAALAEVASTRIKAAAAASAIAMVPARLAPGQSIDGALFFPLSGGMIGPGRLVVRAGADTFEFKPLADPHALEQ